jgi:hypothetical protein
MDLHFNPTNLQRSRIIKEVHYYINDDKIHDSLFVQHCFALNWGYLKSKGCSPKYHVVWNDGCFAQFGCAKPSYFVVWYPSLTNCEDMPKG